MSSIQVAKKETTTTSDEKGELVGFPIPIRVEVAMEVANETIFQALPFSQVELTWNKATRELSIQSPTIFNLYFDPEDVDTSIPFRFKVSDALVLLMNPPFSSCTSVDLETGQVHELVNALVLTGDDVPTPIRRTLSVRAMRTSTGVPQPPSVSDEEEMSSTTEPDHSVNPKKRRRNVEQVAIDDDEGALVPPTKIEKKADTPRLPDDVRIYTIHQDGSKTLVGPEKIKFTRDSKGAYSIQSPTLFDIYYDGDDTFVFKISSAMTTTLKKGSKCLGVDVANKFVAYSGGSSVFRFGYNDDENEAPPKGRVVSVPPHVSIANRNGNLSINMGSGPNVQINRF